MQNAKMDHAPEKWSKKGKYWKATISSTTATRIQWSSSYLFCIIKFSCTQLPLKWRPNAKLSLFYREFMQKAVKNRKIIISWLHTLKRCFALCTRNNISSCRIPDLFINKDFPFIFVYVNLKTITYFKHK